MNIRFNFKAPYGVNRHRSEAVRSNEELIREVGELRSWLYALTEQLEYVIGKEKGTSDDSHSR